MQGVMDGIGTRSSFGGSRVTACTGWTCVAAQDRWDMHPAAARVLARWAVPGGDCNTLSWLGASAVPSGPGCHRHTLQGDAGSRAGLRSIPVIQPWQYCTCRIVDSFGMGLCV